MSKYDKLISKILKGRSDANIGFEELRNLLIKMGFDERVRGSHRVFVNFAREAASHGIPVLRFDFRGHGDSDGHSEDCTIETYLSDIESARRTIQELHPSLESIDMLGLRFGATLAATYAHRTTDIGDLILWEPIVNGSRYMQELLRINLSTQLAVYGNVRENRQTLVKRMQSGDANRARWMVAVTIQ